MGIAKTFAALVAVAASPAFAQSGSLCDMQPDRPNVTNSPTTIDAGHVQVEFGAIDRTVDRADGVRSTATSIGETNVRLGLSPAFEVNVVLRPHERMTTREVARGRGERSTGVGDTDVGAKLNLWGNDGDGDAWTSAFAIQPQLTLPTARHGLGAGRVEAALSLPYTLHLPAGFDLNAMPTLSRIRADSGRMVTGYEGAVELDHDVGPLNLYAEYVFNDTSEDGAPNEQVVNVGATAALGENWVIDTNLEFPLNRAADDFRVLAGVSRRF